jgi:flagellar biosynthesis protein FliQ
MTPEMAIDVFKTVILFALFVASPFLAVILLVGLITSLFQSVTSIQEQTLTFAPKLLSVALILIALGPWLLRTLTEFASQFLARIATMGP